MDLILAITVSLQAESIKKQYPWKINYPQQFQPLGSNRLGNLLYRIFLRLTCTLFLMREGRGCFAINLRKVSWRFYLEVGNQKIRA